MTQDEQDYARVKNLIFCGWIGLTYGLAAYVVANTKMATALMIAFLVWGASYLHVGRKLLEQIASLLLLAVLLALADLLPTGNALRIVLSQVGVLVKSWIG